jgi:LPXTG-motif cell wall-anchored protein
MSDGGSGELPETGAGVGALIAGAGALLAGGTGLVAGARRKEDEEDVPDDGTEPEPTA